jgi:hypothetical protein
MFIKIDLKEHRQIIAGIAAINNYSVEPAKRKKKKGSGYDYGLEINEVSEDIKEMEDDE